MKFFSTYQGKHVPRPQVRTLSELANELGTTTQKLGRLKNADPTFPRPVFQTVKSYPNGYRSNKNGNGGTSPTKRLDLYPRAEVHRWWAAHVVEKQRGVVATAVVGEQQ